MRGVNVLLRFESECLVLGVIDNSLDVSLTHHPDRPDERVRLPRQVSMEIVFGSMCRTPPYAEEFSHRHGR